MGVILCPHRAVWAITPNDIDIFSFAHQLSTWSKSNALVLCLGCGVLSLLWHCYCIRRNLFWIMSKTWVLSLKMKLDVTTIIVFIAVLCQKARFICSQKMSPAIQIFLGLVKWCNQLSAISYHFQWAAATFSECGIDSPVASHSPLYLITHPIHAPFMEGEITYVYFLGGTL